MEELWQFVEYQIHCIGYIETLNFETLVSFKYTQAVASSILEHFYICTISTVVDVCFCSLYSDPSFRHGQTEGGSSIIIQSQNYPSTSLLFHHFAD